MSEAENHSPASSVTTTINSISRWGVYDLMVHEDEHLLSFHDAQDARSLWAAIKKQRLEEIRNLIKSLESSLRLVVESQRRTRLCIRKIPELFSMLEWYVAKVYEQELKGASSSNSQSIAFMSAEIKGFIKQFERISQLFFTQMISYVFLCSHAAMHETYDDEDLLQIDDDAMEEIDIRWQVAMITARIRKFMRKTGRPIDLKPKNGITFDKSRLNALTVKCWVTLLGDTSLSTIQQTKLMELGKRIVPVRIQNSKLFGQQKDSQGHVDLGQDGLEFLDWLEIQGYQLSLESLEVIIRTHEKNEYAWGDKYEQMEYDLKMRDWKLGEKQKEFDNVIKERDELKEKLEKWCNATYCKIEILNKQKVMSDKTCIGFGVEYSSSEESNNSSRDETLTGPLYENFKREKAYKAVPPPTGTIIPPRADVAFTGIDELAIRNKVINKQNSESSGTDHESLMMRGSTRKFSESKEQTVLKSETSSENKSPRSQDSFGQRSRGRGLGYRNEKELIDMLLLLVVCYRSIAQETKTNSQISKVSKEVILLDCDENLVLLEAPRKNGRVQYESQEYHSSVEANLVRGLPSKTFKHDHSCLACRKGKQHKASCKKLEEKTVREPLELLHMDLFGPVSVASLNKKKCDHGTEFKNKLMNEFCAKKGIQREYSIARTPQQNGIAERKNRTLIEAARTML
ncbi:ribonuclease H-like domain-containing protein [Tanacetum coccineum]